VVGRRDPDVERIDGGLLRQGPLPHQLLRQPDRGIRERENGDTSLGPQATRAHERVASGGFVEHKL
jgi:hypothetical protein